MDRRENSNTFYIVTPNRKKIGTLCVPRISFCRKAPPRRGEPLGDLSEKENEFVSFFFPDGVTLQPFIQ